MAKIHLRLLCPCALLLLAATQVGAGAWTQQQGAGFFKLGSQLVRGKEFSELNGKQIDIPTLADYTVSLYVEYGLRDNLTLSAYLPLLKRITLNKQVGRPSQFVYFEGDGVTGIADADVGLRYRLANLGATVISAGLGLGLPLGDDSQSNGLLTGDGEFNQLASLQVGHSLYPVPAYLNADLGFNNRTGGYSDELLYGAEAGYTLGAGFSAILRLRGVQSFENGDDGISGGMGGLYANNQSFFSYGLELVYQLAPKLGVSLSALNVGRVRNGLSAPILSFGVFANR